MLKYNSKWQENENSDMIVSIGQGYIQHEIQHYFIFNGAESHLVSEQFILKHFKEIK